MENEYIADVMHDAREYMEEHGWCRHTLVNDQGQVCTLGAVGMSQGWWNIEMSAWHTEAHPLVTDVIRHMEKLLDVNEIGETAITAWNDEHVRDEQEVLDFFAKAEKIARTGFDPDA